MDGNGGAAHVCEQDGSVLAAVYHEFARQVRYVHRSEGELRYGGRETGVDHQNELGVQHLEIERLLSNPVYGRLLDGGGDIYNGLLDHSHLLHGVRQRERPR